MRRGDASWTKLLLELVSEGCSCSCLRSSASWLTKQQTNGLGLVAIQGAKKSKLRGSRDLKVEGRHTTCRLEGVNAIKVVVVARESGC